MSRKALSAPVAQKYIAGIGSPLAPVTARTTAPNGPLAPACSMAMTGMMVRKMPANSLATSFIGSQLNWLLSCTSRGVMAIDTSVTAISPTSRTRPGSPTWVPYTSNSMPGFQMPLISTRPTTTASSQKLMAPSKPKLGVSGVGSTGTTPSRRYSQLSSRKNATSSVPTRNSVSGRMWPTVQKKVTPFRKPRNSGGSPSGVSEPPMLLTMKMKKITTWALWRRLSLARISGRISSIDAPVVPMKLASSAPTARMPVLSTGEPCRLPRM